MKKYLSILSLFAVAMSFAQEEEKPFFNNLNIQYVGKYGYHPGASIGYQMHIKKWNKDGKLRSFFIDPQLIFYSRPGYNINMLPNVGFGVALKKSDRKLYHSFALDFGFLYQREIMSTTIDFTGQVLDRTWENRFYLLPRLGYELGGYTTYMSYMYGKLSGGYQIGLGREGKTALFFELGIRLKILKR